MNAPENLQQLQSLSQQLGKIAEDEIFYDFKITVEGNEFKVHRAILAARSPYFSTMFTTYIQEAASNEFELKDVDAGTFKEFLNFIYTGRITDGFSGFIELYKAADLFKVDGLKSVCLKNIKSRLTKENAVAAYELAVAHNIEVEFKVEALSIIQTSILKVPERLKDDLSVEELNKLIEAKANFDGAMDKCKATHFQFNPTTSAMSSFNPATLIVANPTTSSVTPAIPSFTMLAPSSAMFSFGPATPIVMNRRIRRINRPVMPSTSEHYMNIPFSFKK